MNGVKAPTCRMFISSLGHVSFLFHCYVCLCWGKVGPLPKLSNKAQQFGCSLFFSSKTWIHISVVDPHRRRCLDYNDPRRAKKPGGRRRPEEEENVIKLEHRLGGDEWCVGTNIPDKGIRQWFLIVLPMLVCMYVCM